MEQRAHYSNMAIKAGLVASVVLFLLTGCAQQAVSPYRGASSAALATFTSAQSGFTLTYPDALELKRDFNRPFHTVGGWKTYMGLEAPRGHAVMALVVPGSGATIDAELRIGVSRNANALALCTQLPTTAHAGSKHTVMISGVPFTAFVASDYGSGHHLTVHSFRAVHWNTCYAIDVLVFGRTAALSGSGDLPFSRDEAFARLLPVVRHFRFTSTIALAPPATYRGRLPCADCPGIDYQLNLLPERRYKLRLKYQDSDAVFTSSGHWYVTADGQRLVLLPQQRGGAPTQWAIRRRGRKLLLLDAHGEPLPSGLNHSITRQPGFMPINEQP